MALRQGGHQDRNEGGTAMSTETDLQTVPVHVVNARELAPAPARSPDIAIITRTFTLKTGQTTGNDSVMARILDRDPNRTQAIIVAQGNPVYLCHSSALAEAAVGDSAGASAAPRTGSCCRPPGTRSCCTPPTRSGPRCPRTRPARAR